MRHQSQKGSLGILVVIPEHQKGYLVYIPHKSNIISSYDIVFDYIFSIALAYTPQTYAEAMSIQQAVSYIPFATYSNKKWKYNHVCTVLRWGFTIRNS